MSVIRFKPMPDSFVQAMSVTAVEDAMQAETVTVVATHPERPGYGVRRVLGRQEAAKLSILARPEPMEPSGRGLRHGPDADNLARSLWVLGEDALEESFADTPVSIAALRAIRSENASHWKPRDVLVDALRRMDNGERALDEHVDALVIAWRRRAPKEGEPNVREISSYYSAAAPDIHVTLGVMERAAHMIHEDAVD